jgi:hypothetical protein
MNIGKRLVCLLLLVWCRAAPVATVPAAAEITTPAFAWSSLSGNLIPAPPENWSMPMAIKAQGPAQSAKLSSQNKDNRNALQAAIDGAANGVLVIPPSANAYRIAGRVRITHPITIKGYGARLLLDLPATVTGTDTFFLEIASSNVTIEGLEIRGAGGTDTLAATQYAIQVFGNSGQRYSNVTIRNCAFKNLTRYSGPKPNTTFVQDAIFWQYVDNSLIDHCSFDTITGNGVILVGCRYTNVTNSSFNNVEWSPCRTNNDNDSILFENLTFHNDSLHPVYYGGAIEATSQIPPVGGNKDQRITIRNCQFNVHARYGAVIRLASVDVARIENCTFNQCNVEIFNAPAHISKDSSLILISGRDVGGVPGNGPPYNITVNNNVAYANGRGQKFLLATNGFGSAGITTPARGLIVTNNKAHSVDADNYFAALFSLTGVAGGWDDITITDNECDGAPIADSSRNLFGGLIGMVGIASKPIRNVVIARNQLKRFASATGADATVPADAGIYLDQYTDDVRLGGNRLDGFKYGVYLGANAGNISASLGRPQGIRGLSDNVFANIKTSRTMIQDIGTTTLVP